MRALVAFAALAGCRGDGPRAEALQHDDGTAGEGAPPRAVPPDLGVATSQGEPKIVTLPVPWLITVESVPGHGVRVIGIDIRSFAAPMLESGDLIVAVDGRPTSSPVAFERYLRARSPGDMVLFTVLRDERKFNYAMLEVPAAGN